jgi:hypothetical protein
MVNSITHQPLQLLPTLETPDTEAAGSARRAQGSTSARAITDPHARQAAHAYVRDLARPHEKQMPRGATVEQANAIQAHNTQLVALAESRANTLLDLGESQADIAATMKNAFSLDRYGTSGTALVGGATFTGVVAAQFAKPNVVGKPTNFILRNIDNPALREHPTFKASVAGAVGGMEAHYPDELVQRLFADAKEDRFFLKPPTEKLHDVMVASLDEKKLSTLQEGLEDAVQIQTYLARALATNIADAALIGAGHPETAAFVAKIAVPLGNYLSGFATAHWKHTSQNNRHERGEMLMLGIKDAEHKEHLDEEQDWLKVYMAAKEGSVWTAIGHGGERMGSALLGAASNGLDALGKTLTSANSLIPGGVGLGVTFAARSALQQMASDPFPSPLKKAIAGDAVNALGTGVAFGIWAFLAATTNPVSDAGKKAINDYRKPREATEDSATATGANIRARLENTPAQTPSLRRRIAPTDLEAQAGTDAMPMGAVTSRSGNGEGSSRR